jgi:hypothetical protein
MQYSHHVVRVNLNIQIPFYWRVSFLVDGFKFLAMKKNCADRNQKKRSKKNNPGKNRILIPKVLSHESGGVV